MHQHEEHKQMSEALGDCLDAIERGEAILDQALTRHPESGQELVELLSLVEALAPLSELSPRRQFAEGASRQLIARLPDRTVPLWSRLRHLVQARPAVLRWRTGTLVGVVAALIFLFALTGGFLRTALAAGPGDLLYGVNLRLEQVQLGRARSAEATMRLHLDLALKRLHEAEHALSRDDVGNALVALEGYERGLASVAQLIRDAEGSEGDALNELWNGAWPDHLDTLTLLLTRVPESAQAAIQHAIGALLLDDDLAVSVPSNEPVASPDAGETPDVSGLPEELRPTPVSTPPVEPAPRATRPASPEGAAPPEGAGPLLDRPDPTERVVPTDPPAPTEAAAPSEEPGPPIDLPVPPKEATPPEQPGPPVEPGPPKDAGPPVEPGPPKDAGPPVEPGPPLNLPIPPSVP